LNILNNHFLVLISLLNLFSFKILSYFSKALKNLLFFSNLIHCFLFLYHQYKDYYKNNAHYNYEYHFSFKANFIKFNAISLYIIFLITFFNFFYFYSFFSFILPFKYSYFLIHPADFSFFIFLLLIFGYFLINLLSIKKIFTLKYN
jgi:hypothetical protein